MLKLKPSESAPNSIKMPHLKAKDLEKKSIRNLYIFIIDENEKVIQ